jgi:hypothetical protein
MNKKLEITIAWLVAILLMMSALAGLAIVNILVSLKYETTDSNRCISQITGYDLCWHLGLSQAICIGSLASVFLITFIAWLRPTRDAGA